jgi:hypothetical protein
LYAEMRLRLLVLFALLPLAAHARSPIRRPPPPPIHLTATIEQGVYAGKLTLGFENITRRTYTMPIRVLAGVIDYDWLTVEIIGEHGTKTLRFMHDRDRSATQSITLEPNATHVETIDLDPLTTDLVPGRYMVRVIWELPEGFLVATANTTTMVPYKCGLLVASRDISPPLAKSPSPSKTKLPQLLGAAAILALLAALVLARRGAAAARVPHSLV